MPVFEYEARDAEGQLKKGRVVGASRGVVAAPGATPIIVVRRSGPTDLPDNVTTRREGAILPPARDSMQPQSLSASPHLPAEVLFVGKLAADSWHLRRKGRLRP